MYTKSFQTRTIRPSTIFQNKKCEPKNNIKKPKAIYAIPMEIQKLDFEDIVDNTINIKDKNIENDNIVTTDIPLCVIITTHNRTRIARETIKFLLKNLTYNGVIRYIISDDRSDPEHIPSLISEFEKYNINDVIICRTDNVNYGLGASLNNALNKAFEITNVVLTVEDDWILEKSLNITNYVKILNENNDLFGIRFGSIGVANTKPDIRFKDLDIVYGDKDQNSAIFNMQVMLRHKRAYDNLGYYKANTHSDEVEGIHKYRYNKLTDFGRKGNFKILWPNKCKLHTLDDPSLYFTHVGKSTVGHNYTIPSRFMYLYQDPIVQKNKRKILVISAGTENLAFQYDVTNQNKKKYCDKYGYEYKFVNLKTSDKQSFHSRKDILLKLIRSCNYDWIMWMDCDTWFHNMNISIDNIINMYATVDTSLIVARDQYTLDTPEKWHDCYINSGVMLFRCNDTAIQMINMWKNPSMDARKWMSKNTVLNDQPYISVLCLWDSFVKKHTIIVQPRTLNTFARFGFDDNCFILHVPGNKEVRCRNWYIKHFTELYNKSQHK